METLKNTSTRISIQSLLSPLTSNEPAIFEKFDSSGSSDKSTHEEQAVLSLMMISTQPQKTSNNNTVSKREAFPQKEPIKTKPQQEQRFDSEEEEAELSEDSSQDDDSDFDEVSFQKRASKKRKLPSKAFLYTEILPTPNPSTTSQRTELSDSDSGLSSTASSPSSPPSTPPKSSRQHVQDAEEEEEEDEDEEAEATPRKHKKARRNRFNDDLWFEHFDELKKFKKKYGHCNVTQAFTQWRVLANWVHNQRKHQGRRMPPNRRQMLVDLGFEFDRSYAAVSHQNKLKAAMRRAAEAQRAKELLEAQQKQK